MGTQFSKIKVTQRVELHGEVFDYADGDYDTSELPELFTRRAHHSGVISGHELLSYSFLGGAACEPRRSLRRKHRTRWVRVGRSPVLPLNLEILILFKR